MDFKLDSNGDLISSLKLDAIKPLVENCLLRLGKVQESTPNFVSGKIRYGLQRVRIRISWVDEDDCIRVVIQSSSDDIWNSGGKNAKQRLTELIQNHNNPGFHVDRLGMHPATLFGLCCLFAVLVEIVLVLFKNYFP